MSEQPSDVAKEVARRIEEDSALAAEAARMEEKMSAPELAKWARVKLLHHALIMDTTVRTSTDIDEQKKASDSFRALVEPILKAADPKKPKVKA